MTSGDTVWANIVQASLTITANNPTFTNSSNIARTGRRAGIIDWNASIVEQSTGQHASLVLSPCLGVAQGGNNLLKLWCDAATYWELMWAHLIDTSDLRVDADTGAIVQQTHNFAMAGMDSSGVIGRIARPGDDGGANPYYWPADVIAATNPF